MNWFLYIGGGILWLFVPSILVITLSQGKIKSFKVEGLLLNTAWISIWVWICWKFIR